MEAQAGLQIGWLINLVFFMIVTVLLVFLPWLAARFADKMIVRGSAVMLSVIGLTTISVILFFNYGMSVAYLESDITPNNGGILIFGLIVDSVLHFFFWLIFIILISRHGSTARRSALEGK